MKMIMIVLTIIMTITVSKIFVRPNTDKLYKKYNKNNNKSLNFFVWYDCNVRTVGIQSVSTGFHVSGCQLEIFLNAVNYTTAT